jgi:zeaxanthin epoxidase
MTDKQTRTGPKILIAGAGIGGLVLAVALLKKGFDVQMFERDLTAIRGEGKYRGPIQVQSNALAALEAIDKEVAEQVLAQGCVTGDRINGLVDGLTGHWYVKFDTFHPAVDKGLPVTRVISRFTLQKLLAEACDREAGTSIIQNDSVVCDFEEKVDELGQKRVWAILKDGRRYEGDILIGADGIWSKVRTKLVGNAPPTYSQYTCYTGISDFTPPDIDTVGYRVFLGNGKYFVSSDVGDGKMQWYGFHKEPEGGKDVEGRKKERLLDIFGSWTDMVTDLIKATPEEDVLRRDIFDRPPVFRWTKGHVALLGDSAHAMQPNLGQGGCMAIEDGYQLATDLAEAVAQAKGGKLDVEQVLKGYQNKRMMRASTIHGLAGSAAIMASTYKAYLGEGLGPLGDWLQQLKIPHPGKVGGYVAMNLVMPAMLSWVLGGNLRVFKDSDRKPLCHIKDKPKHFAEQDFRKFLKDDGALLRAADARWLLVPSQTASLEHSRAINGAGPHSPDSDDEAPMQTHLGTGTHIHGLRIALPEEALEITSQAGLTVGRSEDCQVVLDAPSVSARHAQLIKDSGDFWVTDLGSQEGTWLNGQRLRANNRTRVVPGDEIEFGTRGVPSLTYRIKMCHRSVWDQLHAEDTNGVPLKVPAASRSSEEPEAVAA